MEFFPPNSGLMLFEVIICIWESVEITNGKMKISLVKVLSSNISYMLAMRLLLLAGVFGVC